MHINFCFVQDGSSSIEAPFLLTAIRDYLDVEIQGLPWIQGSLRTRMGRNFVLNSYGV